jgi:pimeloyl-ACP methyl ester carboxylesterase
MKKLFQLLVTLSVATLFVTQCSRNADSGFAEINDTRLYYEILGKGIPLIFHHGFICDHRNWDPQKANPEGTIEMMESIQIPTLIIAGECPHPVLKDLVFAQSKYIPNSKLATIKKSNHMVNIENPNQFNEELETFLKENGL